MMNGPKGGTAMRGIVVTAFLLCVFSGSVWADFDQDIDLCQSYSIYRSRSIEACTNVIRSVGAMTPGLSSIYNNRGFWYADIGQPDRAIQDYDQAIRIEPKGYEAYSNRGSSYSILGQEDLAIEGFDQAIRIGNLSAVAYNELAWLLATNTSASVRNGRGAVKLAKKAVELDGRPEIRDSLAAAYAEDGQFSKAVAEQESAIQMLRDQGQHDKIADFESRLNLYRQNKPYHQEPN
jgi:tetratricopeptide (TPR) repeat protein